VIQVTVGWGGELKSSEANIIKSFVIDAHNFISIFNKLMDWQSGIVWLYDGVGDLRWGYNWEGAHDSVWILLSNLGDKKGSHTWSGTTTKRVSDLETLEAVASFCFFSNYIKYWINQFSTLCVVTLSPVVTGSTLSEDKIVGSKELTERSGSNWVHSAWFQVHQDSSWDVSSTSGFIVIYVNSF
jgi:hypothetical protein